MSSFKAKDKLARAKNLKNERLIKEISSNDLITILDRLNALESSKTILENKVEDLESRLLDYETHTHNYEDKHNTITETKSTQGVNQ